MRGSTGEKICVNDGGTVSREGIWSDFHSP
jgi:hypothetical protein